MSEITKRLKEDWAYMLNAFVGVLFFGTPLVFISKVITLKTVLVYSIVTPLVVMMIRLYSPIKKRISDIIDETFFK